MYILFVHIQMNCKGNEHCFILSAIYPEIWAKFDRENSASTIVHVIY